MFTLSDSVTISGISYQIRTDFCVILEIFVMLDDPDLTHADKTEALIRMFYVERPPDPETASSLVPYAATVQAPAPQQLSLDGLADTIARAISALGDRCDPEPVVRVYLDGKQLSDAVTRYQRRYDRAAGA